MIVELVYDKDCPNVAQARASLLRAFAEAKLPARWIEWDRSCKEAPPHVHGFGSPTVLVNCSDVAGVQPVEGLECCRLYASSDGHRVGVPPIELIVKALANAKTERSAFFVPMDRSTSWWKQTVLVVPSIGVSLLPKLACPACWPAYASLLSAIGIGFFASTTYLFPLTLVFLIVAVGTLGFRAGKRGGYGPFLAGLLASTMILFGKFLFISDGTFYGGLTLLVSASLWNSWPHRPGGRDSCPACNQAEAADGKQT